MSKILHKLFLLTSLLAFILLASCNWVAQKKGMDIQDDSKTMTSDTLLTNVDINAIPDSIVLPQVYNEGIGMQIPGLFRENEVSDFDDLVNGTWYEFFYDNKAGNFYLTEAMARVTTEMDDCLGDSSTYISSKHEIQPLLFIKGLDEPLFKVSSLVLQQQMIWPGQSISFTFNNEYYVLEGDGYTLSTEQVSGNNNELIKWQNVVNYRLYLTGSINGEVKKQLLVAIPSFNDTFVQVLFVGDLDNDGKPDFIFDTSRDYESKTILLMLSSRAKGDEFVRCVGESSYQFDC